MTKQDLKKIIKQVIAEQNQNEVKLTSQADIPGLKGAEVIRAMKGSGGKVYIQLSDGQTIWDAVLI